MSLNRTAWAIVIVALLSGQLVMAAPFAVAMTITVTTVSDAVAGDGLCSLREAIIAANTNSPHDACPAGSGADTITFAPTLPHPAVVVLNRLGSAEDGALSGDLDIAGPLTINGTGSANLVLDGNATDRVLHILPGAQATISGMTIRNGNPGLEVRGGGVAVEAGGVLVLAASIVGGNTALDGGGIEVAGWLTLLNSTIDGNQGGGVHSSGGRLQLSNVTVANNSGYGIHNESQSPLTFEGGSVTSNQGPGIVNVDSEATVSQVHIVANTGSGVHNTGTTLAHLTLNQCLVLSNTASSGGGLFNEGIGAAAFISGTRFSGNVATGSGGGMYNNGILTIHNSTVDHNQAPAGGGIDHAGGNLYLTNVTLSSNSASDNGGGLYSRASALLTHVTIGGNVAAGPAGGENVFIDSSQLSVRNSIVAHGSCFNSEGYVNSLGHNLESQNTCDFSAPGDIINADPLLQPLQDDGGATPTHALSPRSPAVDAADSHGCPSADQRGVPRPQGLACDIGAYELIPVPGSDLAVTKSASANPIVASATVVYTVVVSNAGPNTATALVVTDTLPAGVANVGAAGDGWTCGHIAGVVSCTRPSLPVGAAPAIAITVIAPATTGTITNSVTVSGLEPDPAPGNNSASVAIQILALPRLYLPHIVHSAVSR
jgi:uncharacterized repeat protein (TIGR01451 family)/CSLREA domain-containing protein